MVVRVDQQQHSPSGADHFSRFGHAKLNDPVDGGPQTAVVDFTVQLSHLCLCRTNGCTDGGHLGAGRGHSRVGCVEARLLLVDDLAAGETTIEQRLGAFELLLG
ncbi:hypothetical protein D3C84_964890 [compost metagenome]